ncbi:MAG: OmpH family outer membrane protein [Bacteroidetes bacterium]|nr:OmpH family outer membrane protein [Bacteroidota bacterium]
MKNFSIVLNFILAAAVGYLYYLHFSGNKNGEPVGSTSTPTDTTTIHIPVLAKDIKASKIVYVNADTLFSNYEYVKELRKEAEGKQTRLENNYKQKMQKLQIDYTELQQKASSGALSSDQAKSAEEDMMRRKAELDGMEKQLGDLANETAEKNLLLQDKVNKFLKEYNRNGNYNFILAFTNAGGSVLFGNDSLDITREVLDGLNLQYKAEKVKKK